MNKEIQKICLSEQGQKLEQFILTMPLNQYFNTKGDEETIRIICEWIDLDCMWPSYYLEFNFDKSKFKKKEYKVNGIKELKRC